MPIIYLIRHGQNEDNAEGTLNGHRDRPLTNLGYEQAKNLWKKIKNLNIQIHAIYSSPLARAYQTAVAISNIIWVNQPIIDNNLIERNFGDLTGTPTKDIAENYHLDNIITTDLVTYFPNPRNGESFDECVQRWQGILHHINEKHPWNEHILLVWHGDTSKSIYCAFYGLDRKEWICNFDMHNTDIVKLDNNSDPKNCKL